MKEKIIMSNINRRGGTGANAKDWVVTPSLKTVKLNTAGKFLDGNIEVTAVDNLTLSTGEEFVVNLNAGATATINDLVMDQSITLIGGEPLIIDGGDSGIRVTEDNSLSLSLAEGGSLTIYDEKSGKTFTITGGFADGDGVYYK